MTRGIVTTTCKGGTKESKLSDIPCICPNCYLPVGEWNNFVMFNKAMKDFASSCLPKNALRMDMCLSELSAYLDYGIEMDIRLANALQTSIFVIFVPNADECSIMQEFVPKLYNKEIIKKEEWVKQQRLK